MDNLNRNQFLTLMAGGMRAGLMPVDVDGRGPIRPGNTSQPPNILFILTDNQRADLLGCAGNPIIQTPHLDLLAQRGVRFANAFATSPICAASRASYLTGLYECRHQFTFKTPPLRTEFTDHSYPALLKAAGYRTGFIGKFGIESHGKLLVENEEATLKKMFDHFDNFEHWGLFEGSPQGYFVEQAEGRKKHLTDITAEKAINFLRECQPDQPWCLSVSFNAPHAQDDDPRLYIWPQSEDKLYENEIIPEAINSGPAFFQSLPKFIRESENRVRWHSRFDTPENYQRNRKGLYRMVSGVDRNVGRIIKCLEQQSFKNNTVILFASDHGMYYGERGLSDCWQLNEESMRIPLIICDPRTQGGSRAAIEEMVLNIDLAPTILALAGLPRPQNIQGQNLLPLIEGTIDDWRDEFFCEHRFDHPGMAKSEGVRTKRWKYIRYFEQNPVYEELYDLESDPHESQNLAGGPSVAAQLTEMRLRCTELSQMAASN